MRAGVFLFPRLARQILFFPDWPPIFPDWPPIFPDWPADSLFPRLARQILFFPDWPADPGLPV
jgi:hypothetical protein